MRTLRHEAVWILLGALLLAWRLEAARAGFEQGRDSLAPGTKGLYRLRILEEPRLLWDREKGGRETGRSGAFYRQGIREVRSLCLLLSLDGKPLAPLKVRCSFRISPGTPSPVLSYGDEVEFLGKLQAPRGASNPGQFDYERYLRHKGVAFTAYLEPGRWERLEKGRRGNPFLGFCFGLKRLAEEALCRHLPHPESALLDGILLGERSALPREMVEDFLLTGTVHILAVSGLMTAFVSGVFFLLLGWAGVPRKIAALCSLAGLACFVCMTGAEPPVCRAGLFSALALGGVLLGRKVRGGTLLCATAACLAFLDPFLLFDASFQISFLATAGLMAGTPLVAGRLAFLGKPLAGLAATTLCAQLSVWVLLAYLFNQGSPYAFLANLLVVPLALIATLGGLVLLLGAALHPFLGDLAGRACAQILKVMTFLTAWISELPGAQALVPSPPGFFIFLFHCLLIASFVAFWPRLVPEAPSPSWLEKRGRILGFRRLLMSAWILLGACGAADALRPLVRTPFLRVTYLSVGHGNATVLETPDGKVLVMDAGRRTRGPDRYHPLVSYLRWRGIRKVDWVLATHPDADHVGGLANLGRACRLGSLLLPEAGKAAPFPADLIGEFEGKGVPILRLCAGKSIQLAQGLRGEILHPDPAFRPGRNKDNNLSLVAKLSFGEASFLFPGDLEREGLDHLGSSGIPCAGVDWLLAPHHGRRSGEPAFSRRLFSPRFVVMSDARDHPDARDLYRRGPGERLVLSTAREGAIEVEMRRDGSGRYRGFLEGKWRAF